jgi:hypothetical protein
MIWWIGLPDQREQRDQAKGVGGEGRAQSDSSLKTLGKQSSCAFHQKINFKNILFCRLQIQPCVV